jgi:peptidoglycan-N-acetylglucosamine deacetylase
MKQSASISLDLDNLWAYMRAHGLPGWRKFPSYFSLVVPKVIEMMAEVDIRLTVFVVGQDAEIDENQAFIRALVQAGHGIGNHSFLHEPWMHRYTATEIADEIDKAHRAIEKVSGVRPIGFRGPGFSVSGDLLKELCRRGYRYDASLLPTFIGPLARAAYFRTADLTAAEREERKKQFGNFRDGFKSIEPFYWQSGDDFLLEVPVTTIPVIRLPMHLTYVHFLAEISPGLARTYFSFALLMCRLFRISPSLLLHPLDFVAADELPELACFPGLGSNGAAKRSLSNWCLRRFKRSFAITSLDDFTANMPGPSGRNRRRLKSIAIS